MAWTTPRDWSGISNDIVTAAMLNVDVRDNLNVLSTHAHTGAAGQGGASMSGLTLTSLGVLTFANQSANPDAAGELQRNGNDLLWFGSSVVNLTQADASAGTASLRTLGTTSVKAAAGNHTHEVEGVTANLYNTPQGGLQTTTWMGGASVGTTLAAIQGTTQSPTFTGDNRSRVLTGVWVGGHNDTGGDVDYTVALFIDGSQVASVTRTLPQVSAVGGVDVQFGNAITVTYVEASATSGDEVILKVMHEAVGSAIYHSTMGGGLANYFVTAV
jgi:hypothetical protein